MDHEAVTEAISKVNLPAWVKGWRVSEDLDADNEPMLRVWFQVEPDIEAMRTGNREAAMRQYHETQRAQDDIRKALRDAGIDEWMIVVLEDVRARSN